MAEKLIYPRQLWVNGQKVDGAEYYGIDTLAVGQLVTHSMAAPGTGHITYKVTRVDEQGAWGTVVEDTSRILTRREVE